MWRFDKTSLLWAISAMLLGGMTLEPLRDTDAFWHLATGRWILENAAIPPFDPFSAERKPWIAHEWLFELLLYLGYQLWGEPFLVLLPAASCAACAVVLFRTASGSGANPLFAAPLIFLAVLPTHEYWVQRPQIASYLILSALLSDLRAFTEGRLQRLWHWAGIMVVWANLHAASILAPLAISAHLAAAALQREKPRAIHLTLVLLAVLLAGVANPSGLSLYSHALGYTRTDWHGIELSEWMPTDLRDPRRLYFLLVVAATLLLGLFSRRMTAADLFVVLGFTAMGLRWQRHIPLSLLACAPLLALAASRWARHHKDETVSPHRSLAHGGLFLSLTFLIGVARWPCTTGRCEEPQRFPREALAHLGHGRLFNHYDWGGYLLFHRPGQEVYIDGRTCDIDLSRVERYVEIHSLSETWRGQLDADRIEWLLYPKDAPLTQALREDGFEVRFENDFSAVLHRKP